MKRIFRSSANFIKSLVREVEKDDIIPLAGELTYKLILALFPFLIFLISLLGFFDVGLELGGTRFAELAGHLPPQIAELISAFANEATAGKSATWLSGGLLVSIFSAASGFHAVIRGINISYGFRDKRNFFRLRALSVALTGIFAVMLMCLTSAFVFHAPLFMPIILFCGVCTIYKLASCVKIKWRHVIPGAILTVGVWALASELFAVYVENFARFSVVYGSVAGIFVLMFWFNILSLVLLVGSEVNALIWEGLNAKTRK